MKTILVVVIIGIMAALYAQTQPRPQVARATPAAEGPLLHFIGRIDQHAPIGVLVRCDEWKPYLNRGHGIEEVTGTFLLTGFPAEHVFPDGRGIEFDARPMGLAQYQTVLGATKTVTQIAYAETGHATTSAAHAEPISAPVQGHRNPLSTGGLSTHSRY